MKISHCIDCKEYKYIEKNGMCRLCANKKTINIGKNKQQGKNNIEIKINNLYEGLNIIGNESTGKSKMSFHILNQLHDLDYGIFYMADKKDDISNIKSNNIKTINFGYSDGFNIMKVNRNKNDKNYRQEINNITKITENLIYNQATSNLSVTNKMILDNVLKSILYLKKEHTIIYLYECLVSLNERQKVLSETDYNLPKEDYKKSYIKNKALGPEDEISSILHNLIYNKKLMDCISNIGSSVNIKNHIENYDTVICCQDKIRKSKNRFIINSVLSDKIYCEVSMLNHDMNKGHLLFYDEINNIDSNIQEKIRKLENNLGIINICNTSNKLQLINTNNIIIFRIPSHCSHDSIRQIKLPKSSLMHLKDYCYVSKIEDRRYRGKIN